MLIANYAGLAADDFWNWIYDTTLLESQFRCKDGACYGNDADIEPYGWALQAVLNRFVTLPGQKPVSVDGWIGGETVAAAYRVGQAVDLSAYANARSILSSTPTPLDLAKNSGDMITVFNEIADALGLPAAITPTIPAEAKKAVAPPAPSKGGTAPTSGKSTDTEGTSIWWYILGAVVLIGVGTVGYIVYRRRSAHAALAPARI